MQAPLQLTRPGDGVAVLTMRRSTGPNVVDPAWCAGVLAACAELQHDAAVHALVLRAEGLAFCVGADLMQMQAHQDDLPAYLGPLIDQAHAAVLALVSLPIPVIGCVAGVAAGGGFSLALACDHIVAARTARFVAAYAQLGTTPDLGFTHMLAVRAGPHRALQIALSPLPLSAAQAHAIGLVDALADDGTADAAALAIATRLAALPRTVLAGTKALTLGQGLPAFAQHLALQRQWFLRCAETADFQQRVRAFARRGTPD